MCTGPFKKPHGLTKKINCEGTFQYNINLVVWKLVAAHPSTLYDCLRPLSLLLVPIQRVTIFFFFF